MFCNLNAEMARINMDVKGLAAYLGISEKTARNKLSGRTEFILSEILKIMKLFPKFTIGYLFEKKSA